MGSQKNNFSRMPTGRTSATRARLVGLGRALAACLLALFWNGGSALHAEAGKRDADPEVINVAPFPDGGDFRLQSARGPVSLASMRGQVVLLFFGYITCPDICPTTFGTLQQAASGLTSEERKQLRIAFISVDPERDTPPVLDAYAAAFSAPAVGLTGSRAQIDAVVEQYGAQYSRIEMPGSALRYGIEHSAAVYLIDQRGRLRLLLRHTASPARFAGEIRRLLRDTRG
jgi:protein SCO1/2